MPESLDEVLQRARENPDRAIFISRSGAQSELAISLGSMLHGAGFIPILQDAHFLNQDFLMAMDGALESGARVLALLSREYLGSQYCKKEYTCALTGDPGNTKRRLIVLNVDGCSPTGILSNVAYVRFSDVWKSGNATEMQRVLLGALDDPVDLGARYFVPAAVDAAQRIHPEVLNHDENAFTGREDDLRRLHDALWTSETGTAALTRAGATAQLDEATLAGMAGVGKTTLARAYAYRHRAEYHGIWWIRAEEEETLLEDLISLGSYDLPGLETRDDRGMAAREALRVIESRATERPWLLVYDNAAGEGPIAPWRPRRNAHVLVTSRNPNWLEAVLLNVFTPEAAVEFLCDTAARRSENDRAEAAVLAEKLGRLPLALAHAASKCRGNRRITFAEYSRRFTGFWKDRPDPRSVHGRSYPTSVFATFTMALDDIVAGSGAGDDRRDPCPEAEAVLGVLALLAPEQVPEFLLTPLWDPAREHAVMSQDRFDKALEELHAAGLIAWGEFEDGSQHFGIHRIVQEVMQSRAAEAGRGEELAVLAIKAVESTYQASGTFTAIVRNARWLPHAQAVLVHAPNAGPASWHTLWTQFQIGDLYVERGSLGQALEAYGAGQGLAKRLAQSDPSNAGWQRDLSVSLNKLGDVLSAQGNLGEALDAYRRSLAVAERLAQSDPSNAVWQRDLSVSQEKIGDVLSAQGNLGEALDAYRRSLAVAERLAQSDPSNAGWQRDLSVSLDRIGDVLSAQGNLGEALDAFRRSLAIRERLAQSDPSNAGWQRDLSVSLDRIGDVLSAQGNLGEALDAFRRSLAVRERLAQSDPSNAGWQRDLSVSLIKIGDVLRAQGNLGEALDAYRRSLAVAERLAQSDPSNAGWQRDLWVSYWRLATIAETGQPSEARAWWQKCHDQLAAMKARGILHPPDEKFLVQARAKMAAAEIEMEAGDDAVEGEAAVEMDAGGAAGPESSPPAAPVTRPWWARWFGRN